MLSGFDVQNSDVLFPLIEDDTVSYINSKKKTSFNEPYKRQDSMI